ncbi:MAG: SUMF1/EgtB/PvdO family nonheme iron enzyme [Gammaproteobacteria bacterium]
MPVRLPGAKRVARGGSWHSDARHVRSAFRYWGAPGYRDNCLGFR